MHACFGHTTDPLTRLHLSYTGFDYDADAGGMSLSKLHRLARDCRPRLVGSGDGLVLADLDVVFYRVTTPGSAPAIANNHLHLAHADVPSPGASHNTASRVTPGQRQLDAVIRLVQSVYPIAAAGDGDGSRSPVKRVPVWRGGGAIASASEIAVANCS